MKLTPRNRRALALIGVAVGTLALTAYQPLVAAGLNLLALAWLIWMRLQNIAFVRQMLGGRVPLILNRKWPLLAATLAITWMMGASALSFLGISFPDLSAAEMLFGADLGSGLLAYALEAALAAATVAAPFVVVASHELIFRESNLWKNSGPRSDPPAPTFGPFPPTGLLPAPLSACAEPDLAFA